MRVDLHVHTRFSSLHALSVLGARDCYSDPTEVYRTAKSRGMDLVTFTDHDTIEGCLALLGREGDLPDFFISEEVSTGNPRTGWRLHLNVYGIDEKRHREIQYLRRDVLELLGYLAREGVPAALNHVGSSLTRGRPGLDELAALMAWLPLLETLNGAESVPSNDLAEALVEFVRDEGGRQLGRTGGSDAHTLRRIGWTWTEAEADRREAFLDALRSGAVDPGGVSSRLGTLVRDVYEIVGDYYLDVARNQYGNLTRGRRRGAAACALASLPLHLAALPASGTILRHLRVRKAVRRLAREMVIRPRTELRRGMAVSWLPRTGAEEA